MCTIVQHTIVHIFVDIVRSGWSEPNCLGAWFAGAPGNEPGKNIRGEGGRMAIIAGYRCIRCGADYPDGIRFDALGCNACAPSTPSNLRPVLKSAASPFLRDADVVGPQSMWKYARRLPVRKGSVVSLDEGMTPILAASRLGRSLDIPGLAIKDEGRNPTWSHKDRFSSVAVSHAVEEGVKVVATASSGNAGASLAAYAAKAGLDCVVITFSNAAGPMLSQIRGYGATVVPMDHKAQRWEFLQRASVETDWYITSPYRSPVIGSHPVGIEGYKTIAYEIFDQTGGCVPDWCALPVCYGDALSGIAAGFQDLLSMGMITRLPRLVAAEVHGSLEATLASGCDYVEEQVVTCDSMALSIGTSRSTYQAVRALRDTDGRAVSVSNHEMLQMQRTLAKTEGIFAELASVAPLVAVQHLRRRGVISQEDQVISVVTASGLKDVGISDAVAAGPAGFSCVEEAWRWLIESSDQAWRFGSRHRLPGGVA